MYYRPIFNKLFERLKGPRKFIQGLITGIQKYASEAVRQKASSPKLQVLNTALISAQDPFGFRAMRENPEIWGAKLSQALERI
jgi:hypothetical protein